MNFGIEKLSTEVGQQGMIDGHKHATTFLKANGTVFFHDDRNKNKNNIESK